MVTNSSDYQKNYMKNYARLSPTVECQCGAKVKAYNIYHHRKKSKQHYVFINDMPDVNNLMKEITQLKKIVSVTQ